MLKEDLGTHLLDINNLLSEDSCNGFPYLELKKTDYSLKNTESAYKDYINLIKKFGYANKWDNGKISFFNIHPVFSDAKLIPSLLGLHLSLVLFDKEIAGTSQTLYFDTATNWLKFTKISDRRIYALSTWMRFNSSDLNNIEDIEDDSHGFIYTKSSIFLIKGNELESIHKKPPTDFHSKLFSYYQKNPTLLTKPLDHRSILESENTNFSEFIADSMSAQATLKDSANYLFMVLFCREFNFSAEVFNSLILEYSYKFDFSEDKDIIQYTDLALSYINDLLIRIGQYSEIDITYKQNEVYYSSDNESLDEKKPEHLLEDKEDEAPTAIGKLEEFKKNFSITGITRFYEMSPALNDEDAAKQVYEEWRKLIFCFLYSDLNQEYYNKLRSTMDSYVVKEIETRKLSQFQNLDYQVKGIYKASFNILQYTLFEHFRQINDECSNHAKNIFQKLKRPALTLEQEREKNIRNSRSQIDYLISIELDLLVDLNILLQQSIGKIAHPSFINELGDNLAKVDQKTLKQKVIDWYVLNYIEKYLEMTDEYNELYAMIENDAESFAKDEAVNKSLLKEASSFIRTRYDPALILDFGTNY